MIYYYNDYCLLKAFCFFTMIFAFMYRKLFDENFCFFIHITFLKLLSCFILFGCHIFYFHYLIFVILILSASFILISNFLFAKVSYMSLKVNFNYLINLIFMILLFS